jgi:hypothetical protein
MNEAEKTTKLRDRAIAENESAQQTTGDIRVSIWAVAVAMLIGVAAFGWVLTR